MERDTPATAVYLVSPDQILKTSSPFEEACFEQLREGFALQAKTAHTLASDPESATLVIAPIRGAGYGPCFEALRSSAIYRDHAEKLVVYSPATGQFPALRGLYPSVSPRWVRAGWALPAHYISAHIHRFMFQPDELINKDLLFSFVGASRTHPIRERIVPWRHPRSVVLDASPKNEQQHWWEKPNKDQFVDTFRDVTRRSRFVLCPRGVSASSIRLFEAMEAAAVPVILADDLELPLGPQWEEFSFRVREREVDKVPSLIERWEERAEEMGAAARRAWEEYFSPQASVGSVVGWAQMLLQQSHRRPLTLPIQEYSNLRFAKAKLRRLFSE